MNEVSGNGRIMLGGLQFAGLKGEKKRNIEVAVGMIREAAKKGAQIVMTPEVALSGFMGGHEERQMAEPIPGPSTEIFMKLSRELGIYILVGLSELNEGEVYDSMAVIGREGSLMGIMRKVHFCPPETSQGWRNGSDFPVWKFITDTGQMIGGIMICYDREMPESARILMLKGVDVIFNPLGCNCPTREIHRCLLRTRALENEAYIFMVNHAAPRFNGNSMAIDYKGNIIVQADEQQELILYEADIDALRKQRQIGIYGMHNRRPELYRILSDPAGQIHPPDANPKDSSVKI